MTRIAALAATGVLVLGGACAKKSQVRSPSGQEVQYGESYQAPPGETIWGAAWDTIESGAEAVAEAGEWTLERAEDGAVVAWRTTKQVAGAAGEEVSDATILASVKSRLGADRTVSAFDINVDVEDRVVWLYGEVGSSRAAASAVRTTLGTRGVERVVSYLRWPGMQGTPGRQPVSGQGGDALDEARDEAGDAAGEAADEAGDAAGEALDEAVDAADAAEEQVPPDGDAE